MTNLNGTTLEQQRSYPAASPEVVSFAARREQARAEREAWRLERINRARAFDQAAAESLRAPVRVPVVREPRRPAKERAQGPLRVCTGTCGRMTRPKNMPSTEAPGIPARVKAGMCSTCNTSNTPRTTRRSSNGVRPCAGPCGRLTRTRGTTPDAAPGTITRLRDGMCSTCANGRKGRPKIELDMPALIAEYEAGATIMQLATKHDVGKSTIHERLVSAGVHVRTRTEMAAATLEDADHLIRTGLDGGQTATRLGRTSKSLARLAQRNGRPDLARVFERARYQERKAKGAA